MRQALVRIATKLPVPARLGLLHKGMQAWNFVRYRDPWMFQQLFCEIGTECNRACWYCPTKFKTDIKAHMPEETYLKILSDLKDMNWRGGIGYHYLGEPMKDPRLPWFIRMARERCPRAVPILFTNGDYLTEEKVQELLDAGLVRCSVTQHPPTSPAWEAKITRLVNRWPQLFRWNKVRNPLNIGGAIEWIPKPAKLMGCRSTMLALPVRYNGDVTICCCDWKRQVSMGNVLKQSLESIWNSTAFRALRKSLRGGAEPYDMCHGCTAGRP